MRIALIVLLVGAGRAWQPRPKIEFACTAADIDQLGLSCTPEHPCPVTAADSASGRLFVTGNLHTESRDSLLGPAPERGRRPDLD